MKKFLQIITAHKVISGICATIIIGTASFGVTANNLPKQVSQQNYSSIVSVSSKTSSSSISIVSSSLPISNSSAILSSSTISSSTSSFIHGEKQTEWTKNHHNTSSIQQTNSQPNVSPEYVLTIQNDINTYKTYVSRDNDEVKKAQQNLQAVKDNKNTMVLEAGSSGWVAEPNPEDLKRAQDELKSAQQILQDDQRELEYWKNIAKVNNIPY